MATCDLPTLLRQACENGFDVAAEDKVEATAILLQLLCELSAGGNVVGSGQIKFYTADPNIEGVVPDDQTKPAIAYAKDGSLAIFGWNTTTLQWN